MGDDLTVLATMVPESVIERLRAKKAEGGSDVLRKLMEFS